ncbi:MAG: hypothetical protein IJ587_09970 [Synergistaceae bacterium]|nr:hypothetical protein [Synergistaceae bacterium]
MSNGLAHQRVLRTVRLLPQAVKIGILESEIKQSQDPKSSKPEKPSQPKPDAPKIQVKMPSPSAVSPAKQREINELSEQVKALTSSLSSAEVANAELSEAKAKLESEIGGIKSEYERRRKQLEDEAKNNADRIAEKARAQAISEGQVAGYEEGLKKARAEVEQEYFEKFSELAGVIDTLGKKLEGNFAELVKLNQPRLIRVWTEMLNRMLHRQVELNPDTIDAVLSELLSRLSDKNQILIYVSPEDMKRLEGKIDTKFREALRGVKKLELKSDPNIENGSCIVETGLGVYDARWKTQMGQVESVVDEVFQQSSKEDR